MAGDTARSGLAGALESGLHKQRYIVVAEPRPITDYKETGKRIVQVVGTRIEPAANALGDYKETLIVWVCTSKLKQPDAENDLESGLHDVIRVLDGLPWCTWDNATRAIHPSNIEAWSITVTAYTGKE